MSSVKDLHTHILFGVDDGAKTLQESLAMLSDSFDQGIRFCALTPHCVIHKPGDITNFLEKRQQSFEKLEQAVNRNVTPQMALGAEVYADHDISQHDDISKLCIGDTNYILVELPFLNKYEWFADCVYSLNLKGFTVIVAHIDRYPLWEKILNELRGLKVVYQINASRLLSFSGRRLIKKLLRSEERFVVASDMHNMTFRKCDMAAALKKANKMDPVIAKKLFWSTDAE